jgi:uncharacterized protein (UPF0332 family)
MIASERIKQAQENKEEALLLLREHMGNKAVLAKLYHAMMECLFALLDISELGSRTHADVIERFEREFIGKGTIDRSDLDALRRTYDLTHECDCDHMPVPTDTEVAAAQRAAEDLIRSTETLLTGGGGI